MNTETNYASLFYSESQNDIDFLEKTVANFPVSSVARFLLLYHNKKNNLSAFDELAKKTGVYLNNPLWIQFQLSQIEKSQEKKLEDHTEFATTLPEKENKIPDISERENQLEEEKLLMQNPEKESPVVENKEELFNEFETESNEKEISSSESLNEIPEIVATENKEEIKEEISSEEQLETTVNEQIIEIPISEIVAVNDENKENSESQIKEDELVNEQITQIPTSEIESVDDENIQGFLTPEIQSEENLYSFKETEKESSPNNEKNVIDENQDSLNEENHVADKSVLDIRIPEEIQKEGVLKPDSVSVTEEETISFEPLHTVDYFASQGIKISEEALANDHLGKQVKSFTAWLKSMKKLHPGQLPEQNEVIEKIIQSASEASNQNAHVLTEAMAEVLLKQGKREKAVEMYEKLSLINPSKSGYFAAKIESLKII